MKTQRSIYNDQIFKFFFKKRKFFLKKNDSINQIILAYPLKKVQIYCKINLKNKFKRYIFYVYNNTFLFIVINKNFLKKYKKKKSFFYNKMILNLSSKNNFKTFFWNKNLNLVSNKFLLNFVYNLKSVDLKKKKKILLVRLFTITITRFF